MQITNRVMYHQFKIKINMINVAIALKKKLPLEKIALIMSNKNHIMIKIIEAQVVEKINSF